MNKNISITKKVIRIEETWKFFLNTHPEIQVKKQGNKIIDIVFSPNCTNYTFFISEGKVLYLSYCLNDKYIVYNNVT